MSSTTVQVSCNECFEVGELVPADVLLRPCSNRLELSTYEFTCPSCRLRVVKPADSYVVALLSPHGVVTEKWSVPAEALEPHSGNAISPDDILDLALALARPDSDDLLAKFAQATS